MKVKKIEFENPVNKSEIALQKGGLDWLAEESDYLIKHTNISSKFKKSILRSDTKDEIGAVGKKYHPVNNTEAFSFFDIICEKYSATYQYACQFNNGSRVLLYAELPENLKIREEEIKKSFTLINGFDGIQGLEAYFVMKKVSNNIEMRASVPGISNYVSLKHTKNIKLKMEEAFRVFSMSTKYFVEFEKKANELTQKIIEKEEQIQKFLDAVIGEEVSTRTKFKRDSIIEIFNKLKSQGNNTSWDLFNAVVEFLDTRYGKTEDKRLVYNLIGRGATIKEKAFITALKM